MVIRKIELSGNQIEMRVVAEIKANIERNKESTKV
jgi:hypothetical protein